VEFGLVAGFDFALRNKALFSEALDVLFQTLLISVIRKASQIRSRNDPEFSKLSEREDFGVSESIGTSAIVVGRAEVVRKTLANHFVPRRGRIASLSIYV
jgi:hypothetical protein